MSRNVPYIDIFKPYIKGCSPCILKSRNRCRREILELIERIKDGLSRQDEWPPLLLHLLLNEIADEKAKLEILVKLREFLRTRLILIDERIRELEGEK